MTEWREAFDLFAKLLPGASIIAAILLARRQLQAARRATAVTIAKTHYREFITLAMINSDITVRGATPEALEELKNDPSKYRRYRWLATQALFALQEIYFAIPEDKYWRRTIVVIASNFRAFILSPIELPPRQREGWHTEFMDYVTTSLVNFTHPVVSLGVPLGETTPASSAAEAS